MAKTPRDRRPDPMAREVDRLLAQLANGGSKPERDPDPYARTTARPSGSHRIFFGSASPEDGPTAGELVSLWARVLLGVALGALMTQWPYRHGCGSPLVGYLAAVVAVMVTGAWIAFASWRFRNGVAHIVSLVLLYWGIVLAAEQVLPRIGYAADQASWRCMPEPALVHGAARRPA